MIRKLFDTMCQEQFNKNFSVLLYLPKRWRSVNIMFSRLMHVRCVLITMGEVVTFKRTERKIGDKFKISTLLAGLLICNKFWSKLEMASSLMNLLCQRLGFMKSES